MIVHVLANMKCNHLPEKNAMKQSLNCNDKRCEEIQSIQLCACQEMSLIKY